VWRQALSATQVDTLYDAELPVKQQYGNVGLPPFVWTKDGDNVLDAVDGIVSTAAKDNWAVVGGVAGDVDAMAEWRIDPVTAPSRVFWLGRKATRRAFTPDATLWLEYSGTADVGNSSGDAYEQLVTDGTGSDIEDFDKALDEREQVRGRFQVLGRLYVSGASIDVQPYFKLGSSERVLGDTIRFTAHATVRFRDFGELWINWGQAATPPSMTAGLLCAETAAAATTLRLDFVQLLPYPCCRVECEAGSISLAAGDTLVIDGVEAYVEDASDGDSQLYRFEHTGEVVDLEPGQYNYIFLVQGEEQVAYPIADTATLAVYVTPRWLLPGGLVA
jgi:hypothetical protein